MDYNHVPIARHLLPGGEFSKWQVYLDADQLHGYFEHNDQGEGGELWFARCNGDWNLELTDYDGVSCLCKSIWNALLMHGIRVDDVFKD
jgi:hypothetical protein